MIKIKKISAVAMASLMAIAATGCAKADNGTTTQAPTSQGTQSGETKPAGTENNGETQKPAYTDTREIHVGTWWEHYYVSKHQKPEDNPNYNPDPLEVEKAEMQIANMRKIEEKYNIRLIYDNLTWDGIQESISMSIMSGKPDCDIYEVDTQFGVPAVLAGYAIPVKDFAAADSDIFTTRTVMKSLSIEGKDDYLFASAATEPSAYLLGFNLDMIREHGLENPQDLFDRGEWTWDKFREYLQELTVTKDGVTEVYGYAGWWNQFFGGMMRANGGSIAATDKITLDDPKILETLEFIDKIYNVDGTAAPWWATENWDTENTYYVDGKSAFWIAASWIMDQFKPETGYGFEYGVVPYPIGPSGNQETNKTMQVAGNWNFIPVGAKDPDVLYNVYFDWTNWYDYDTSLRDDFTWFRDSITSSIEDTEYRNYSYLTYCSDPKRQMVDLWDTLKVDGDGAIDATVVMNGTKTPAQMVEEQKEQAQALLDKYFGK